MNIFQQAKENKEESSMVTKEIEKFIHQAIEKVKGSTYRDLCRFLPNETGEGYMHHFTFKKKAHQNPNELKQMLQKFIINVEPKELPAKKRAPKISKKEKSAITLTGEEAEKLLEMLKKTGSVNNDFIIKKLVPRKSLSACKKDLIHAIRHNKVDIELWKEYVKAVQEMESDSYTKKGEFHKESKSTQNSYFVV